MANHLLKPLIKQNFIQKIWKIPQTIPDQKLIIQTMHRYILLDGEKNNFDIVIKKVFRELEKEIKMKEKKISARFICVQQYIDLKKTIHSLGIVRFISNKKIGKNGFGYDPIFVPKGRKKLLLK